jgi:hypothetical protein
MTPDRIMADRASRTAVGVASPSPVGGFLVPMTGDGLHRSGFAAGAWQRRVRLPGMVKANGSRVDAPRSPGGRSMLSARDAGNGASGDLFAWRRQGTGDRPPACADDTRGGDGEVRDGR